VINANVDVKAVDDTVLKHRARLFISKCADVEKQLSDA
jgi:hypothetical protein